MGDTIHPTHTCFDDVFEYLVRWYKRDPLDARAAVIVHGICLFPDGPRAGERFAHAWIEHGEYLSQSGIYDGTKVWFTVSRAEWYAKMRPQQTTRYTLTEAWMEVAIATHLGPWRPEYRALCGRENFLP